MTDNKSIFLLASQAMTLAQQLVESGGELSEELCAALETNNADLVVKCDGYGAVLDRFEAEQEYWKKRATECHRMAKAFETVQERIRNNLQNAMQAMKVGEIVGTDTKFKLVGCKKRLVIDPRELTKDYLIETVVTEPDREKISAALAEGFDVPGAYLEGGVALRKMRNKGEMK